MSSRTGSILTTNRGSISIRKSSNQKSILQKENQAISFCVSRAPSRSENSGCSSLTIDDLTVCKCGSIKHLNSCTANIECLHADSGNFKCLETCNLCVTGDVIVNRDLFVKKDIIVDGKILTKDLEISGELITNILKVLTQFNLPLIPGAPTGPASPAGQVVFDILDRQLYIADGTTWQVYDSGEDAPPLITVDPSLVPNKSTIFSTIQEALDSLRNRRINETVIKVIPKGSPYNEQLIWKSRVNSDPISLTLLGDERGIAGCGIAHEMTWNRSAVVGPEGGGRGSRAALFGTAGGTSIRVGVFSYIVGTVSQTGTTITGVGTNWDPHMIGGVIIYSTMQTATVTAWLSSTSLTVTPSQIVPPGTTYVLTQGSPPDFVSAGVIAGDRIKVRHNQGSATEFGLYTITSVSTTVTSGDTLNVVPPLLFDVNDLGAAIAIVPNVEITSLLSPIMFIDNCPIFVRGFYWTPVPGATIWGLNAKSFFQLVNNLTDGGGFVLITAPLIAQTANQVVLCGLTTNKINDLTPPPTFGNTFMDFTIRMARANGLTDCRMANNLVIPRAGVAAYESTGNSRILMDNPGNSFIGNNATGYFDANDSSEYIFLQNVGPRANQLISTGGTVFRAVSTSRVFIDGPHLDIRSTALVGPSQLFNITQRSWILTGNVIIDCPGSASGFIVASAGAAFSPQSNNSAHQLSLILYRLPSSSLLGRISNGGVLSIVAITNGTLGSNTNGFQVDTAASLLYGATNGITGGGGASGVAFDVKAKGIVTFDNPGATRTFTGFSTMFNFDTGSEGYISQVTTTTSGSGTNTNLIVANGSSVVIDTATFNPSGANIGISQRNGGQVIRQTGTIFTNNATTPILGPTISAPGGDLINPIITADSTDKSGTINASTVAGGLPGNVTITFSSPFAVTPTMTLTAFGSAKATNLGINSITPTSAVISLITPPGADTAFGVSYITSIN